MCFEFCGNFHRLLREGVVHGASEALLFGIYTATAAAYGKGLAVMGSTLYSPISFIREADDKGTACSLSSVSAAIQSL